MEKLIALFDETICPSVFTDLILSNSRKPLSVTKVKLRPILLQGKPMIQAESFRGKQVFHQNMSYEETKAYLQKELTETFQQCEWKTTSRAYTALVSKKGTVTVKKRTMVSGEVSMPQPLSHNRSKQYVLPEGTPIPYLVELGVMTSSGQVKKQAYDKYRQINRFLEFIRDILPHLPRDHKLTILDFGCGKSYLTFAMYDYLKLRQGFDLQIIGLDLKEEVIRNCQTLADRLGYEDLHFLCGDIANYPGVTDEKGVIGVDMVVTLHACDLATDYALSKAVSWGARVILSVPCCQHELNRQISCEALSPILSYGLIKERSAALFTDALRAQLLESMGYRTQILEFIDMEHTPKNILLRGVFTGRKDPAVKEKVDALCDFLQVSPTLRTLLYPETSTQHSKHR